MSQAYKSFAPEIRTLAFIPRWSIVWVQRPGNVAEHSYFVALYADEIANLIKWSGPRHSLLMWALLHDADEIVTGDMVSPVKTIIIDQSKLDDYTEIEMNKKAPRINETINRLISLDDKFEEMNHIVLAADRLECLLYLIGEQRMGNTTVIPLISQAQARLQAAWSELPCGKTQLSLLWATKVVPEIKAHYAEGGSGVV